MIDLAVKGLIYPKYRKKKHIFSHVLYCLELSHADFGFICPDFEISITGISSATPAQKKTVISLLYVQYYPGYHSDTFSEKQMFLFTFLITFFKPENKHISAFI